jgi:hypothetical protein
MAVFVVNITDGGTFASLDVGLGRGPKGDGFTGGSFNAATGQITFTSNDGIGFTTDDVRVDLGAPGPIGDVTPSTGDFTSVAVTGELTAAQYNSTEALPDIKPSLNLDFANTKALDPRITYTRGSTATYYDGKTFAKAEENLLLYSQEFDNAAWVKLRATVTADADTAPDGTTTADAFIQASGETTSGRITQTESVLNDDYVLSIYAKPNGKNLIIISETLLDGTLNNTWFNVSTGTVGTTDAGHTAAISASVNGYYRCSIKLTVNAARSGGVFFFLADTDGSTTVADDGNGLYLWGAQLEQRSALTDYTATTTQPITNYVPALQTAASGEPRFDHDPITGESKGFLIEEQRTNLLTYSEQFDNAAWSKANSSITSNIVVAPDGTLTGDKLVEDTGVSVHRTSQAISATIGEFYTVSCFAKAAERGRFRIEQSRGVNSCVVHFDLDTQTISLNVESRALNPTIQDVGGGWYRCSFSFEVLATGSIGTNLYGIPGTSNSWDGDGYSGIYIWGAQLEQGSFPTSYIPTVASQVTRSPDAASMTGTNFSSWYRQDEGTLFIDAFTSENVSAVYAQFRKDSTNTINFDTASEQVRLVNFFNSSPNAVLNLGSVGAFGVNTRLCGAYKRDDFAGVKDAGSVQTDTSGNVALGPDTFNIGRSGNLAAAAYVSGHIKKLAFYPKRLSNATLQALTEE